jgi:hypothetical protein
MWLLLLLLKGHVHLRHDLRFDLRFGACVIMTMQENAFAACVRGRRTSRALAAMTQGDELPVIKLAA